MLTHVDFGSTQWVSPPPIEYSNEIAKKIDEAIWGFIQADNPFVYSLGEEQAENVVNGTKVVLARKKIKDGFGIILLPVPTLAEEVIGISKFLHGFWSLITSIGHQQ